MKRFLVILCLLGTIAIVRAEKRIYFFRAHDLPAETQNTDLRPDQGLSQLTLNNIYRDEDARYALFTKRADSWWQVMVETAKGRTVDLSDVDNSWCLKLKIRRTVNYPLTLVLAGTGTANGYSLPTTKVPANGEWTELTIPLNDFPVLPAFTGNYSGRLLQIHSDLGYAGDLVGIDYCYLTDNASSTDPGTVQQPKRYYFVTNTRTPLAGVPYSVVDYSNRLSTREDGWRQWAYIPFPYFSMESAMPVAMQLLHTSTLAMDDVNDEWYIVAQIRTNVQGAFACRLYLPDGTAYTGTIDATEWVRDNVTWNRLFLPLDRMAPYTYTAATDILFAISSIGNAEPGEWSMASLIITNDAAAEDPTPYVPADPAQETRIYLINDGSPLPTNMNCTDYRLDQTAFLTVGYGNNTTRKASDPFLTLLPTNGWYSADISAQTPVDLTSVDASWTMHTRIRTTSSYRPINIILYKEGNAQLARYQLTEALLPVAQNGTWFDYDIPMTAFLTGTATLIHYTGRIFSFHSDNGGIAGVEVSMEYLYFSHEGESKPDPQPGIPTADEPDLTPVEQSTEAMDQTESEELPIKVLYNGRIYIRMGNKMIDLLGRTVY